MANPTFDVHSGAGRYPLREAPPRATPSFYARPAEPAVLAPGESSAHPPADTPHWDLGARVALIAGLAVLSWAVVGAALVLLLHHH